MTTKKSPLSCPTGQLLELATSLNEDKNLFEIPPVSQKNRTWEMLEKAANIKVENILTWEIETGLAGLRERLF
jgi:ATP phosphoribosyltransferase